MAGESTGGPTLSLWRLGWSTLLCVFNDLFKHTESGDCSASLNSWVP